MVAKEKKKKNIQSEEGEPKQDPGLVFVGSGEKTQSPGVKVAESGGDPQLMPDEELTSSPEAVPPCPEEEGTSTELPQSDYETGSKTGGGTEAEAVESGESVEKDGADGKEDEGMNKYQEPVFVVTSNGMEWCKENIEASKGDVYFSGDGNESNPAKDFAILAHCNHTIMTIGTFGYWAGYLVGGETVYLSNFTLPESPFLKEFKYEAAFLPEWHGIPADLSPLLNSTKP
ncbi:UNVERIFIED_CONTAM: hypothetical protein FKN15_067788 [Acipenser sinensis]